LEREEFFSLKKQQIATALFSLFLPPTHHTSTPFKNAFYKPKRQILLLCVIIKKNRKRDE